jgi:hypothetical protein
MSRRIRRIRSAQHARTSADQRGCLRLDGSDRECAFLEAIMRRRRTTSGDRRTQMSRDALKMRCSWPTPGAVARAEQIRSLDGVN